MSAQWTIIQSAQNTGTSPVTVSINPTSSKNILVVSVYNATSNSALTSVKDSSGTSLVEYNNIAVGTLGHTYLYMIATPAAAQSSIVATYSGATLMINVYELAGSQAITTNGIASAAYNTTTTTSFGNQPSITTTDANDFILTQIGISNTSGTATPTVDSSFTLAEVNPATTSSQLFDAYLLDASAGTYNPSFSWTTARKFAQLTTALVADVIVPIQRTQGNSVTGNTTAAFGVNNTAGNCIIVIAFIAANITNLGISDTLGNSYTSITSNYNSTDGLGFQAWVAYNIAGGANTVTVTNGSNATAIQVWENSGVPTNGNAIDSSAFQYQHAVTSLSSTAMPATTNATDIILAASVNLSTGATYTKGTGFFNLNTQTNASLTSAQEEFVATTTGAYAGTFTISSNSTYSLTVAIALSSTSFASVANGNFLSFM